MNMWSMLVNFDTSHFGMSPFSDKTLKKMTDMSFTLETSHSDISPYPQHPTHSNASQLEVSSLKDGAVKKAGGAHLSCP